MSPRRRRVRFDALAVLCAAVVWSSLAAAQTAPDSIDAILQAVQPPPSAPPPAAEAAPPPAPAPSPSSPQAAPPRVVATAPPPPRITAPVHIDELDRTPDGPPTERDLSYESRLRASFASAQGLQGPLDGRWTLSASGGGGDLYVLQIADTGLGALEGAWRDPRRPGALGGSGFLDQVMRNGSDLSLSFQAHPGVPSLVTLSQGLFGGWSGELRENGDRRAVVLRRDPVMAKPSAGTAAAGADAPPPATPEPEAD